MNINYKFWKIMIIITVLFDFSLSIKYAITGWYDISLIFILLTAYMLVFENKIIFLPIKKCNRCKRQLSPGVKDDLCYYCSLSERLGTYKLWFALRDNDKIKILKNKK